MNTPMQPLQQSNVPQSSNNVLHSSRTRVHTHVVTLERVQQSSTVLPHQFNVQEVARQQYPRFYQSDQGLLPFYHLHADVECIRGALESSWDLTPTTTTAPPAPSPHKAQLQRLKREAAARGDHTLTHAGPNVLSGSRRLGRTRGTNSSSSVKSAPPDAAGSSATSVAAAAGAAGLGDQQTCHLQVLMNLWQLHSNHDGLRVSSSLGYNIPLPQAPRMLTAEEELVLATIIQQNRKLQQLASQHPDTIAAALATTSSSRTSSSASTSRMTSSSSSSTFRQPQYKDKRHRWPPPLTAADVAEVSALPAVWRAMLPTLAAQAQELLVAFNTGLVFFILRRSKKVADVPEGDMVSSGLAGLRLAASRFDPKKGTRFSTMASMWIAQHIARSSVAEAGRAMRRPEHHLQMVRHVAQHYSSDVLRNIERHPDVAKQVASHFKMKPSAVITAINDTLMQHAPTSLEALATNTGSSKSDYSSTAYANLLTTTDLDEDSDVLRGSGQEGSMSGGVGTLLAAAGQIPTWAQASMRVQQEQQEQLQGVVGVGMAGGGGEGAAGVDGTAVPAAAAAAPAASGELVAAAAAKLLQLAADTASPSASVTGTMLDTIDDVGGLLEANMQSVLQVLTPLEQQVITVLYGLDQDVTAGLGVELASSDLGSVSSEVRGRPSSSSSSSRSRSPSSDDVRSALAGRNPKVLEVAKSSRGVITLKKAAALLGFGSHQLIANVRNQAVGKLVAAARQATAAAAGGSGQLSAAGEGPGVGGSLSSWDEDPAAAATAAAAVIAPPTYTGVRTIELIELLRQYVQEHGHLPQSNERYKGELLLSWMQRLRTRYWKGKVSPVVVSTIEKVVPGWDWGPSRQPATAAAAGIAAGGRSRRHRSWQESAAAAAAVGDDDSSSDQAAVAADACSSSSSSSSSHRATLELMQPRPAAATAATPAGGGDSGSSHLAAAGADVGSSGSSSSRTNLERVQPRPATAAGGGGDSGSSHLAATAAEAGSSHSRQSKLELVKPRPAAAAAGGNGSNGETTAAASADPGRSGRSSSSRRRRTNLELVQLLQQYVQEYGQLPHAPKVCYKGSWLFNWMQRLRACYKEGNKKGLLSPVVIDALQAAVPMWTWDEAPSAADVVKPTVDSSNGRRSSGSNNRSSSSSYRQPKQQG